MKISRKRIRFSTFTPLKNRLYMVKSSSKSPLYGVLRGMSTLSAGFQVTVAKGGKRLHFSDPPPLSNPCSVQVERAVAAWPFSKTRKTVGHAGRMEVDRFSSKEKRDPDGGTDLKSVICRWATSTIFVPSLAFFHVTFLWFLTTSPLWFLTRLDVCVFHRS